MSTHELAPYRMTGPSALAGGWRRLAHLSGLLALTEFRLRFFGSVLGYLWTLMRPLLLFAVLYVVFAEVLQLGDSVPYYGVVLLLGIVLYEYFAEATGTAVPSVVDRESFVRKVHFPRMAIPLSVTLTSALNLVLNFVAVFFFVAAAGVALRWGWLELPLLLVALVAFATGVAMLLSALYVRFRDLKPIWEIVLRAMFYATPVLYPIEQLAERSEFLAHLAMCNPVAAIIVQLRHAMIDPTAPSAAEAIGGAGWLLIPAGVLVGSCVLGLWVFNRMAPRIAEEL
jgi:ABC-2 type transport system permease protein